MLVPELNYFLTFPRSWNATEMQPIQGGKTLLFYTKKRWPAKPFFFLLLPGKTGHTENGILQIYKHGENGQNTLQMAWLCEEPLCAPPRPGSVPSWWPFGFLPEAPPRCCLSQIGQRTRDPALSATVPRKAMASLVDAGVRGARSAQSRRQWGCFPGATLSSL